jgi:branched-chain amino acid aminotransferase
VTRGEGPLGFDPSFSRAPTWSLIAVPVKVHAPELYRRGIRAALARVRRNSRSSLDPAAKTTNNLNNILAKMESLARGAYEAVMLNADGYVAEGTICNVFFVSGGALKTPSLDCGLLAGVTRSAVIALARRRGLSVVEGRFRPRDLFAAREVFLTSTTFEVLPVSSIVDEEGRVRAVGDGRPGPWAPALRHDFRRLVERETGAKLP